MLLPIIESRANRDTEGQGAPTESCRFLSHKVQLPYHDRLGSLQVRVIPIPVNPLLLTLGQMINKVEEPIRIALIDDDASVRSAVSRLLRSHDYACKAYESAESALSDPDLARVDCLVLDVQLSGMNGFALRDRLLQDGVLVPCLFITAHAETDSPEWLRSVGHNPCVIKPFDESQLLTAIHNLIDRRSQSPSP